MSNDERNEFTENESKIEPCSGGSVQGKGPIDLSEHKRDSDVGDNSQAKAKVGKPFKIRGSVKQSKPKRSAEGNARSRSRTYVATLNNYHDSDISYYRNLSLEQLSWIVVGQEVGENGTPHLQMACRFNAPTDLSVARRVFGRDRAHIEIMKGTCQDSFIYCSKEKLLFERGVRPSDKGKEAKAKLDAMVIQIKDGNADRVIFEANPSMYLRYRTSINAAKSLYAGTTQRAPLTVIWLWGETGF